MEGLERKKVKITPANLSEIKRLKEEEEARVKEEKLLLNMVIHSRIWSKTIQKDIVRVHGGWIYSDWNQTLDVACNPIFIPYSNI